MAGRNHMNRQEIEQKIGSVKNLITYRETSLVEARERLKELEQALASAKPDRPETKVFRWGGSPGSAADGMPELTVGPWTRNPDINRDTIGIGLIERRRGGIWSGDGEVHEVWFPVFGDGTDRLIATLEEWRDYANKTGKWSEEKPLWCPMCKKYHSPGDEVYDDTKARVDSGKWTGVKPE
jgi:hypothetical protein